MKIMTLLVSSIATLFSIAVVTAWSPTNANRFYFRIPASLRTCTTLHTSLFDRKGNDQLESSSPERIHQNASRLMVLSSFGPAYGERTVVILYHKPASVITSHSNMDESPADASQRRRTVYEDIFTMNGYVSAPGESQTGRTFEEVTGIKSKLHAIGRLDADTTGALLLTNDGALVHRITNPNSKDQLNTRSKQQLVQKTYEAVIMGHHVLPHKEFLTNSTIDNPLSILLENGVALSPKHGGQTRPVDKLSILSHPTRTTTVISITISEGKNRQIRRMLHAIGSGVMKLHRVSVGGISLGDLKEGEWRLLSAEEILSGLGYECRYLDGDEKVNIRKQGLKRDSAIRRRKTKDVAQRTKRK